MSPRDGFDACAVSTTHALQTAAVPPQNLEAEEAVLGAMLLSETAIGAVTEILDASDFYRGSHGTVLPRVPRALGQGRAGRRDHARERARGAG